MQTTCAFLAVVVTSCTLQVCDVNAQEKSQRSAALQHYIGTWQYEVRSQGNTVMSGEGTTSWVLAEQFVEQRLSLQGPDGGDPLQLKFLRGWDVKREQYRSWSFASSGDVTEWTGSWNAASRTMTWTAKHDQNTLTMTSEFNDQGDEEWTLISLDEFGHQQMAVRGTNRRVGES
jgi:hypothetical protein